VINLQVPWDYAGTDPAADLRAAASTLQVEDPVGMMTAADVRSARGSRDGAAQAWVTVGLGHPVAAGTGAPSCPPPSVGTINMVVVVDRRVSDAALLNLLTTATEAKCQALADTGVEALPGVLATGTATDAVTLLTLADGSVEPFGGPLSTAGGEVARAVYRSVRAGAQHAIGLATSWNR
jgi:adenosylcobinamide hydrolase